MKKVTPKQFKEFTEETLRNVHRREKIERKQEMKYEEALGKLLEQGLVNKRAIKSAEKLAVLMIESFPDSIIARVETSNRVNALTIIPSTGDYHCSCMKKESQKVCKDILAYLREALDEKRGRGNVYKKTLKWLGKITIKR